jgi:hypothetical protein
MNGYAMALASQFGYEVVEFEGQVWSRDPATGIMRTDDKIIFPSYANNANPNLRLTVCPGSGIDFRIQYTDDARTAVHFPATNLRALRRWIKDHTPGKD